MNFVERWKEIVAGPEEEIDLAEAALLVAAHEYPRLDVSAYLKRLHDLGTELKRRLRGDISPADSVVALNRYLFEELGFGGNTQDYYDPRNSFLNDVLDRRLGIPITLSIVYAEIGRRLGLALHGVSFPGHFLVKCAARDGVIILDPYARGASLSLDDLQRRLRALRGGTAPPPEVARHMLAAASKKDILAREYRDRAALYLELECHRAALSDFRNYLMLKPDADDAATVHRRVVELQQIAARLN